MVSCSWLLFAVGTLLATASNDAAGCPSCQVAAWTIGKSLVQVHQKSSVVQTSNSLEQLSSWAAGSFGDCVLTGNTFAKRTTRWSRILRDMASHRKRNTRAPRAFQWRSRAFQWRPVECRAADSGEVLPDDACATLPRPRSFRRCDCGLVVCHAAQAESSNLVSDSALQQELGRQASGSMDQHFVRLGCLHESVDSPRTDFRETSMDESCLEWTGPDSCRLGLPFYRWSCAEFSAAPGLCFQFCLGKGLDLFALANGTCRCGASALNTVVWRGLQPRTGLSLPWHLMVETSESTCYAHIYRYRGHFEDGAVPLGLTHRSVSDEAYMDSLAMGWKIHPEEEEDLEVTQPHAIPVIPPVLLGISKTNASGSSASAAECSGCPCTYNADYPCFAWYETGGFCACWKLGSSTTPERCASFGGSYCPATTTTVAGPTTTTTTTTYTGPPTPPPGEGWLRTGPTSSRGRRWPDRQDFPPGFDSEDVWEDYVVIKYTFDANVDNTRKEAFRSAVEMWRLATCINFVEDLSPQSHHVLVGIWDTGSCYANVGWWTNAVAKVNLGWCKDSNHVGSMAHELGHILGMTHEQKRPDGSGSYYGKGPHLKMYWENVPERWVPQYTGDDRAYTGSLDDGPNDAQVGYADYDFGSIMHYGGGSRFDTIPASAESQTGNREQLSEGDIKQMFDVYECRRRDGTSTETTTTTTTTPATTTTTSTPTTITTTTTTTTTMTTTTRTTSTSTTTTTRTSTITSASTTTTTTTGTTTTTTTTTSATTTTTSTTTILTTTTPLSTPFTTLEVRQITVKSSVWLSFQFQGSFAEAPVVVVLPTAQGDEPAVIRLRDVSATGFSAIIAKPPRSSTTHANMDVTFMAAARGGRTMPGSSGLWLEAGHISTRRIKAGNKCLVSGLTQGWASLPFQHAFSSAPALLTALQTVNNEQGLPGNSQPWFTVAVNKLESAQAQVALDMAETSSYGGLSVNQDEVIGYIAVQQGVGSFQPVSASAVNFAVVLSNKVVRGWGQGPVAIPFGADLGAMPLVVASQASRFGGDGGWLRLSSASSEAAELVVDEDQTCNTERGHMAEKASVVAFSGPVVV